MIKQCAICGRILTRTNAKTCSDECRKEYRRRYAAARYQTVKKLGADDAERQKPKSKKKRPKEPEKKTCPVCGEDFWTTRKDQKYCCSKCKEIASRERAKINRRLNGGIGYENAGSLCWRCRHAVPSIFEENKGCSWSRRFEPIPGWEAREVFYTRDDEKIPGGYLVKSCPEFERG